MVCEVAVSHVNCLNGDEFFWGPPHARHQDPGIRMCSAPTQVCPGTLRGCSLQQSSTGDAVYSKAQVKLQFFESPTFTWFIPSPYCPSPPVKAMLHFSFPRSQCRTRVGHLEKQNSRIIYPLESVESRVKTPILRIYPQFPSKIY